MIQVGGHGQPNPNETWLSGRGLWFTYFVAVMLLHFILLSVPILSIPLAWTLTNLIHNACHFIFLHVLKGAPWEIQDCLTEYYSDTHRVLTHWEQIDYGVQFTRTRKFLTIVPVVLFLFASFYTRHDSGHFVPNFVSLMLVLLPKLPVFDRVRLFGINKVTSKNPTASSSSNVPESISCLLLAVLPTEN